MIFKQKNTVLYAFDIIKSIYNRNILFDMGCAPYIQKEGYNEN